jgi:hypothetical protein
MKGCSDFNIPNPKIERYAALIAHVQRQ